MRTLQWQKIPIASVIGKSNLWTMVGRLGKDYEMDYTKMDALFSVNQDSGPKRPGQTSDAGPDGKKKKENSEINLLDGKRSLNVNIFLKQFRMSHEEIVQLVRDGRSDVFGAERLRGLLKLLPSQEEIDDMKGFDGDKEKLGNAEKFFLHMMGLPNYRMRIEGLLIMEEFNANMEWIRPSIEAVIQASKDIQENKSLKELIFLILMSGNYLNSGNYAGNAAGFKLSSLLKLTELRANKPRMNLLHYVAQEAKEKNPKLLDFPKEMKFLKDASQVSVDTLSQDINNIANKVKAITEQIVVAGVDFQQQMASFLKEANVEVVELEEDLKDIEMMRTELATFFAEDQRTFKLEECFDILKNFCDRLQKAIGENVQREIQEQKAEKRRRLQEEEAKRNSKELPESPDESTDQSTSLEDEDGSIVDMLLADVRSGFTSCKFNDGNFSVKKVTKVNLLDAFSSGTGVASTPSPTEALMERAGPSFIRGGPGRISQRKKALSGSDSPASSPTPDSAMNQRRSPRSYATEDNESLIDFLMESEESMKQEPIKPETTFERYGSLRRRHQERKEKKKHNLEVIIPGRELASSPSIPEHSSTSSGDSQDSNVVGEDRPRSENDTDPKVSRSLRRTRSWLDKPSVDKANAEIRAAENKDSVDSSDALLDRIKQKLSKKSEDRQSRLTGEDHSADRLAMHNNIAHGEERNSSRWRSGISVPDTSLETISEKNTDDNKHCVVMRRDKSDLLSHSCDATKLKYRKSLDPSEFARVNQNTENISQPLRSQDDSDMHSRSVAVSVRKKISSDMGTNIDQVLKRIEDSGRTIDTVGVSGPMKRTPEASDPKAEAQQQQPHLPQQQQPHLPPQQQVAVVAHVTASYPRAATPVSEQDLKAKRDKRKKRSTLSMDDVKAAMKSDLPPPPTTQKSVNNNNNNNKSSMESVASMNEKNSQSAVYYHAETGKPVAKTPPSPRRPNSDTEKSSKNTPPNNKELSKAAKLAAKKKFRDARFGDSSGNSRAKSNVEADGVDQALKELANQNSMSRSKSYDEHVAKNGDNEFSSNVIKRTNNGGSAPDTADEKKAVMRNSTSRLSVDGRRNGLYIPSDESDTELTPEDAGTQRLSISKSDSPQNVSQGSLKSTNTSTETLGADIESSPEQKRKNSNSLSPPPVPKPASPVTPVSQESDSTPTNFQGIPMAPRPQSTTAIDLEQSTFRRSYSLMERTKLHTEEEDSDNPLAKMAKWRMNRSRHRKSFYDNVPEVESSSRSPLSPSNALSPDPLQNFRTEVSELKNEVGSRSSYASSYASSNERDEGFETGSGTASDRTSMSSTIDSDFSMAASIPSTSSQPRREVFRSRSLAERREPDRSVIQTLPEADSVISSLTVEADRKERTESWTEQTVRANSISGISKDQSCDNSSDYAALSPDSGHSTSKEDIWTEELNVRPEVKEAKKKDTVTNGATVTKTKSVPSYMKSTSSSNSAQKTTRTSTKTNTTTSSPSSASTSSFRRDAAHRVSVKDKEAIPTIKRDMSSRASMRAEPVSSGFQRGTIARKSVRGPRTSISLSNGTTPKTTAPSSSSTSLSARSRADSTTSISSTASSASNISTNVSSSSSRLHNASLSPSKSSPSTRSVTPSNSRPVTPSSATRSVTPSITRSSTPSATRSATQPSSTRSVTPSTTRSVTPSSQVMMRAKTPVPGTPTPTRKSGGLSRTQSMRVSSTRTPAAKEPAKRPLTSTQSDTSRRSMTPLSHEMKRSSTPLSHDAGSRSTTPLPERPHSTTPMAERTASRRSSFMAPTAASKAKKETTESPTTLRTKTLTTKSSGPLLRTASLRLPKKSTDVSPGSSLTDLSTGRKSPAIVDSPLQHKGEHYQSLSTVTEQDEEKDVVKANEENDKKSSSLLKRMGIVKGNKSTASSAAKAKSKTPATTSTPTKKK